MEFIHISLGSNCSITEQLKKYNLRSNAYPFDWCNISINQLIEVLNNDFDNYSESLEIKNISEKHLNVNKEPTLILKNKYCIKFAHEICNKEELEAFKEKIQKRISKFKSISGKIIFYRIELKKINKNYLNKIIDLHTYLNKYFNNFEIKVIINPDFIITTEQIQFFQDKNIKIIKYDLFSEDWKMNHLDWNNIFSI